VSLRPVAKDGFTLPASQAITRAASINLPSGETADFEFTPTEPGDFALNIGRPDPIEGSLRLRVIPRRP
jgi:hypothetical protein